MVFYINSLNLEGNFLASVNILKQEVSDNKLEKLAKCLSEKDVKLYGASWDGHTQNQKEVFKDAVRFLSYVECANNQCKDSKIRAFPTWIFPNNKVVIGEISIQKISELSGCGIR